MKKKILALVCLLLCLFGAKALAQQNMHPVHYQRIEPNLPAGMVFKSKTITDGQINIVIDTYATDWDMVAAAAQKSGSLAIHPGIKAPGMLPAENIGKALGDARSSDYYRQENETAADAENRTLGYFVNNTQQGAGNNGNTFSCSYQGWSIGRYDEGTGLFLPEAIPASQGAGFAVYWRMEDGSYRAERVRLTVNYTELVPVYTRRQKVDKDDIRTGLAMNGDSLTTADAARADGSVVYTVPNTAVGRELHTAVAAPSKGSWTKAYLIAGGKKEEKTIYARGAHFSGRQSVVLFYKLEKPDMLVKKDWAIQWEDDEGNVEVTSLQAVFKVGAPGFTASYAGKDGNGQNKAAAVPAPKERLTWTVSNPLDGLSVSFEQGDFHMAIDEDKLPANRKTDLSRTTVSAKVIAPEGAVACSVYRLSGDVIYGNSGERQFLLGSLNVQPGEALILPELQERIFFREISVVLHNGKVMSYYVSPSAVGRYGGETLILEWMYANKGPTREYIALTTDAYQLSVRRNPSETKNPTKAVEIPTVQMDSTMVVETAELPQKGDNTVRYEIAMYDQNGEKAQPDAPVLLYLPYPDGKSMDECAKMSFAVHHQLADGSYEEYSTAKGNLTLTKYGLCMEITSFSPYFLMWDEAPTASAVPQTGDDSALWLCAAMLAASAAGMIAMRKKNETAA